jgi:hypothetical protein
MQITPDQWKDEERTHHACQTPRFVPNGQASTDRRRVNGPFRRENARPSLSMSQHSLAERLLVIKSVEGRRGLHLATADKLLQSSSTRFFRRNCSGILWNAGLRRTRRIVQISRKRDKMNLQGMSSFVIGSCRGPFQRPNVFWSFFSKLYSSIS